MSKQSKDKGKPFLIPTQTGEYLRAYPKSALPDTFPVLEINGVKNRITEKLKLHQYIIGGLPLLLIILGGALGGLIGALTTIFNYRMIRSERSSFFNYLFWLM